MKRQMLLCLIMVMTILAFNAAANQGKKAKTKPKSLNTIAEKAKRIEEVDSNWPECDEFVANAPCKVVANLANSPDGKHLTRSPWDVKIKPAGEAVVLLKNASPLLSCTLAAVPGALTRDASTSITSFLTTLGTLGAFGNPKIPGPRNVGEKQKEIKLENALTGAVAKDPAASIDAQLDQLEADISASGDGVKKTVDSFHSMQQTLQDNWQYSYSSDEDFEAKAAAIWMKLSTFLNASLPNIASLQIQITAVNASMAEFHRRFDAVVAPSNPALVNWMEHANDRIVTDSGQVNLLQDYVTDALNARTQLKQAYQFLTSISDGKGAFNKGPYTAIILPMTQFSQKQVTESVTCKDVVTQTQAFDVITFTAYYEGSPKLDFSAGALVSFLGGRQVGMISGPLSQATSGNAPPLNLGVTNSTRVQWIPTAFVEYHPLNFKCPWATNGAPTHPFGYVCSFGGAFGLAVNPNNGTTTAEYFEGISFGIHRVAIFIGNHTGKVQDFTEGYFVGEMNIPAGTTPPTHRRWTNHPAIGISYRIPLR